MVKKITFLSLLINFTISSINPNQLKSKQILDIHIGHKNHWANTYLVNTQYQIGPDGTYDVVLRENEYQFDKNIDLLIHFNQNTEQDYLGNYIIKKKDFSFDSKNKVFGNSSGKFLKSKNTLILRPKSNSLFYRTQNIGSFTIEFWIYPSHLSENGKIFKRYGPIIQNGKVLQYSGIIAKIQNQRLKWSFHNIFHYPDPESKNIPNQNVISIQGIQKIKQNQWSHHALSYNSINGKLTYFINGQEKNFLFVTTSKQPKDTILTPRFYPQDKSLLKIGENFFGLIDEFVITLDAKETQQKLLPNHFSMIENQSQKKQNKHFNIEKYTSKKGFIISHVYELNQKNSYLQKVKINAIRKMGTYIILQYRISPYFFTSDQPDTFLNWKTLNLKNLISLVNFENQGKYFQWRTILVPSHNGKYSPTLQDIYFQFKTIENPNSPKMLKGSSSDRKIILTWQGNLESRVNRYKIYYGFESRNYLAENHPIEVNIQQLADKINPAYELNNLNRDTIYYITVTALDKYGNESLPSNEIIIWTGK